MAEHPDPRGEIVTSRRPWGGFEQLSYNESTTVKVITVSPGHRLSLQTHARRAELWQVLDGPLEVTVGDETWTAATDERVWVPLGARHRMRNPGEEPARVLEIAHRGYVLAQGRNAYTDTGEALLQNAEVRRLFLGG